MSNWPLHAQPLQSEHTFHIPVMGTGFTNTTALAVAPLGVSSVIALADDTLLEQQRSVLSRTFGVEYLPIETKDDDARARRTRAYLDLIADEVERRVAQLRSSPFEAGSPIQRYFELLPETATKAKWRSLSDVTDPAVRMRVESELRAAVIPGQIEVNIMTKLDGAFTLAGVPKPANQSDAVASLRGFAMSKLRSIRDCLPVPRRWSVSMRTSPAYSTSASASRSATFALHTSRPLCWPRRGCG